MVWASVSHCCWLKSAHRVGSLMICAPEKVCPVVVSRKNCPMRSPNPPNPPLEKLNPVGAMPNPPSPPPPKRENPYGAMGDPPPPGPKPPRPPPHKGGRPRPGQWGPRLHWGQTPACHWDHTCTRQAWSVLLTEEHIWHTTRACWARVLEGMVMPPIRGLEPPPRAKHIENPKGPRR